MNVNHCAMDLPRVVIVGGGEHACVVADCIRAAGDAVLLGYSDRTGDSDAPLRTLGLPRIGDDSELMRQAGAGRIDQAILGMAGHAHSALRSALVQRLRGAVRHWHSTIHPRATVAASAQVGEGVAVLGGAVVNPLARIDAHAVINTCAVVEHHCEVGEFAVISPRATLCGHVRVGAGAFVGAGAVVLNGMSIGAGSVVGAGAVVREDVPGGMTVVGVPARILRYDRNGRRAATAAAGAATG